MRSSSFREPNCVFFGAVCGEGRSSARPPELGAGLSDRSSAHREAGGGGGEAAQCPQLPGGHVAPPPPSGAPRCVARLWRHRRAPRRAVMTSPKAGRGVRGRGGGGVRAALRALRMLRPSRGQSRAPRSRLRARGPPRPSARPWAPGSPTPGPRSRSRGGPPHGLVVRCRCLGSCIPAAGSGFPSAISPWHWEIGFGARREGSEP